MTPAFAVSRVLLAVVPLLVACAEDLDRGAALTAALAASGAFDALDDLGVLEDPDAAGQRDAFRAATVGALERAREANRTAPRATAAAYRLSLNAGELADHFGLAFGAALEARGDLVAAEADSIEAVAAAVNFTATEKAQEASARRLSEKNAAGAAARRASLRQRLAAAEAAERYKREADAIRESLTIKLASPEQAALIEDAYELTALVVELTEDTNRKIETAEDLRRQAMSAYRAAAEAWRALTG